MGNSHLDAQARRVVSGVGADGRSCVVSDEYTRTRLATPGNTKCDIWRFASLPTTFDATSGLSENVITDPPEGGFVYRVVTFPPDSEWDRSQGYSDANGQLAGTVPAEEAGGIPGMHFTRTVDILTVLSGELWAVLESEEVCLRPGDTFVQRGTVHAWSNRGNEPATIVALMVSAEPPRNPTSDVKQDEPPNK
ncbi:cupin domain-containing protein [Pseudarthrobacter sp. NPDC080039]|uniref:cupin domain-containing protein n=1 Tax=unclassified Pseudarthrobacter TaxID=2647000 RepID=UPI00345075D4